jgi:hypothetical protein
LRIGKQQGDEMRTATVVGIVLIGLGVLLLACFMAPLGFLIQTSLNQQKMNLVPLVLGAIALISGIVLLAAVSRRVNKGQE